MKKVLVAALLTGLIGVTGASAQKKEFVDLKITNGFDEPLQIYVVDHNNGRKIHENNREISPGGTAMSKAKLDRDGYIDIAFSVKAKATGTKRGYYCLAVKTSAKDKSVFERKLLKKDMKESEFC